MAESGGGFRTAFQSTLPRRERQAQKAEILRKEQISIHAPAKGATVALETVYAMQAFQSTLPRRERPFKHSNIPIQTHFNPRSREGSDINRPFIFKFMRNFNPRSREGSDNIKSNINVADGISIHAPAKGATVPCFINHFKFNNFNPRSREGSDDGDSIVIKRYKEFQSTLPRRERPALVTS